MVSWLSRTQVKFIRFVHSQQWWSCQPCHSWTQSAPWLPQYSCPLSPYQRPHVCHPPTQSWQSRWKTRTVCVGACICHGQDSRTCMLQDGIRIFIFLTIDGLATSTIMACEVTTLLSLELCLQTAWKRHGPRARCWQRCRRTQWGWPWLDSMGGSGAAASARPLLFF